MAHSSGGGRLSIATFNTLTRTIEEFVPLERGSATIYTCGPTVYRQAHIGNLRSPHATVAEAAGGAGYSGYEEHHGRVNAAEMLDQAGQGDRRRAGRRKTPAQIAQFYTRLFLRTSAN
jgi:hypothetical protein